MLYTSGKKENTSSGEIYSKGSVVISEELLKYDITLRAAAENKAPDVKPDIPVSSGDGEAADKDEIENPPEETKPSQEQNLLEETKPLQDVNTPASELPAVKEEQQKPDVSIMEIIHPTYKNSNNGKIIGVSSNMEYSVDGGNTWITCTPDTISGLGEGSVKLRFFATPAKNSSPIAIIELKSVNKEYYIPTICMTKKMGLKQKFQLKFANVKGAAIECSSSNSSIVTVNKKGLIKSKKKQGKAKVVVSIIKGNHIVQYIAIIKVRKSVKKNYSLVKFKTTEKSPAIALYKNIPVGKKWKMRFDYTKNAKLTFYSSNKDAAYVDKKGNVTGIGAGKAIIYIKVENEQVTDWYYVVVRTTDSGMKTDTSYLKVIK